MSDLNKAEQLASRAESAAETVDTVGHTKSVVRTPVVSASPAESPAKQWLRELLGQVGVNHVTYACFEDGRGRQWSIPELLEAYAAAQPVAANPPTQVDPTVNTETATGSNCVTTERSTEGVASQGAAPLATPTITLTPMSTPPPEQMTARSGTINFVPIGPNYTELASVTSATEKPTVSAMPTLANPPKVEEAAREIIRTLRPSDPGSWDANMPYVMARLESLGPFFSQVSQPPTEMLRNALRRLITDKEPNGYPLWFNRAVRACKSCDSEDLCRTHHEMAERDFAACEDLIQLFENTFLAAPVTPVSANGTEPQLNRDDLLDLKRIMELLREHDISDTDVLKHTLEDHDRWRAEMLAGAASHNGLGWVRVEDRLPKEMEDVWAWNSATNEGEVAFVEDGRWKDNVSNQHFTDLTEVVTHWQPLPAPPSEANGPQEEE